MRRTIQMSTSVSNVTKFTNMSQTYSDIAELLDTQFPAMTKLNQINDLESVKSVKSKVDYE